MEFLFHLNLYDFILLGLMMLLLAGTDAHFCPDAPCINEYFPNTRRFWRTCVNLSEVPHDIPSETLELPLYCNSITGLPVGAFSHLTQCTWLGLFKNQISFIEKETFIGLVSLKQMYLNFNKISVLEPGAFAGLNSMETLYLWGNLLTRIQNGTFADLHKLETLLLNTNHISQIQDGAFDSLFSLKILDLSANRLTTLSPDLLTNLPYVPLQLGLSDDTTPQSNTNQWNCSSLSWLKCEEEHGTITWWVPKNTNREQFPVCSTGGDWRLVHCHKAGECLFCTLLDLFLGDLRWVARFERLPKVCLQQFHGQLI